MGMFGRVEQEEFQRYKRDTAAQLAELELSIRRRATDSEEEAKIAAMNAQAIELQMKTAEVEILNILGELKAISSDAAEEATEIKSQRQSLEKLTAELTEKINSVTVLHSEVLETKENVANAESEVAEKIELLNGYLEQGKHLPGGVEETKQLLLAASQTVDSINNLYDHGVRRKKEIDGLYREIYGEDHPDQQGGYEHVDGIKDHLENSYRELAENVQKLDRQILELSDEIASEHKKLFSSQRDKFDGLIESSSKKITSIQDQLTGLLPGAMAEGLSAAYEAKTKEEIVALQSFETNFKSAILGMICVSALPLGIDAYLVLAQGKELLQVIKDTPGIIAAVLPLYFPILWLAHSSNKKYNLSKRLIEEYTHKSVLGKTFSGLSNQIEGLEQQGTVKEELRNRLLHNVLQVSAENPGKLITDYQKSDHPLMEALENSVKLADAITKLSKVPGFSAVAKRISEKNEKLVKEAEEKVSEGLKDLEVLEEKKEGS